MNKRWRETVDWCTLMVAHSRINRHISSQVSVDKGQEEDGSQQQLLGSVPDNTWQKRETKVEPKKSHECQSTRTLCRNETSQWLSTCTVYLTNNHINKVFYKMKKINSVKSTNTTIKFKLNISVWCFTWKTENVLFFLLFSPTNKTLKIWTNTLQIRRK